MSESTNPILQEHQPVFLQLIKTARGAIRELDLLHQRVLNFLIIDRDPAADASNEKPMLCSLIMIVR